MKKINKALAIILIFLSINNAFAQKPADADLNRLKDCLTEILKIENDFFEIHKRFTDDIVDLNLADNPLCKDIKIDLSNLKEKEFVIEGTYKKHVWTINHKRTMRKIK